MDVKKLKANLEKLNKCKGLSEVDLKGKYKKAYEALQAEIYHDSNGIMKYISIYGIRFQNESIVDELNALIKSEKGTEIMKKTKKALIKECSYENFIKCCYEMRAEFLRIAIKNAPPEWDTFEFDVPQLEE